MEFDKIRSRLAALAQFAGGREIALSLQPCQDLELIEQRLAQTDEGIIVLRFHDTGFLARMEDIAPHLYKVKVGGVLRPSELAEVLRILQASRRVGEITEEEDEHCPHLRTVFKGIIPCPDLEARLRSVVDKEGELRDNASSELRSIRNQMATARTRLKEYLREFVRSTQHQKYLQDAIVTERGGRYVVPVKIEYRNEIKGIVHDESASGATVFIEPAVVVDGNNKIRRLELEEEREIERILSEASRHIAPYVEELVNNLELLKKFDFILARARLALEMNGVRPIFNDRGLVRLRTARHPLLGSEAVPIDLELGQKFDILVITGPNTGGKTVALKTVGLLVLMGMAGLFVPAGEGSELSCFDAVYADIGDEQSIEQSLSTFSSHMSNIIRILGCASSQSLVLLDELGAGTDPLEGSSLARAILEELLARQAKAVVTTHQSELKAFAYQHERVENASVEFDPITLMPTYKLAIGIPGQSNAFEIAERLGLKGSIVARAREFVPQQELELGRMLRDLKEARFRVETERQQMAVLQRELREERDQLQEAAARFEEERREALRRIRREGEAYLTRTRREADEVLGEIKELLKQKESIKWHELERPRRRLRKLRMTVPREEEPAAEPDDLIPGSYVEIRNIGQKGYILEGPNASGEVMVQVGIMKLTVDQDQLRPMQSPEQKVMRSRTRTFLDKARQINPERDLRGMTVADALHEVEKYLEDAHLAGLEQVRIIHGKGTGALRKAIQDWLGRNSRIKSFRDGERTEGGFGVTVVYLK